MIAARLGFHLLGSALAGWDFHPLDENHAQVTTRVIEADLPKLLYDVNAAYWEHKGLDAWRDDDVPSAATSNLVAAQEALTVLFALRAASPQAHQRVDILEVGGGSGAFAINFLRVLQRHRPAWIERGEVRYLFSDASRAVVQAVAKLDATQHWIERGLLLPCLLDLRRPQALETLDGAPVDAQPAMVVANYVCCTCGVDPLQKRADGWFRTLARVEYEGERALTEATRGVILTQPSAFAWGRDLFLQRALAPVGDDDTRDDAHWRVITQTLEPFTNATMVYPRVFFEALGALRRRLRAGGAFLITAYGLAARAHFEGLSDQAPERFGQTLNYELNVATFDALARHLGLAMRRTRSSQRCLQHVLMVDGDEHAPALEVFEARYVRDAHLDRYLRDVNAANAFFDSGQFLLASIFFHQCVERSPDDVVLYIKGGVASLQSRRYHDAVALLERGKALTHHTLYAFSKFLGRAYHLLGDYERAIHHYHEHLQVSDDVEVRAWLERAQRGV